MTTFLFAALGITALALLIALWPLFKTRSSNSFERQAQNIHFAQERLKELEAQLANDGISADDYNALKLEIENTLADDIDIDKSPKQADPQATERSNKWLIWVLVIILPIAGLGSYWKLGTPQALQALQALQGPALPTSSQDIETLVASVEARLEANPSDAQGWGVLARTYLAMGRYADAKKGFLTVMELQGESADGFVSLADATALIAGGNLAGEPSSYLERALALQPDHPQALWLAGLSAAQQNDLQRAREHWDRLLPLLANNPEQQQELREIIQQTFDESTIDPSIAGAAASDPRTAAEDSAVDQTEPGISVRVSLADALQASVSPDDLVFVFAKAQNGPAAPLAVQRLKVSDLPRVLRLTDANAMMAQFKLSLFENIVVSARVAKSGNPVAQTGDIQSPLVTTTNHEPSQIELEISMLVE